jgi:methionine synthase I (cobalamin-dependent)
MTFIDRTRFLKRLDEGHVLFDGGMGSMMIANGLPAGSPPEEWNRSRPEVVRRIHAEYVLAGAEVITTNSFGATPSRLAGYGLGDAVAELNNLSVKLARDAIASVVGESDTGIGDRFVAFSVGPTGKMLPPVGQATESDIGAEFSGQIGSLDEPADLIMLETFFDVREALLALEAAKRLSSLPVGISVTFNKTPRGFFTVMGDTVPDCMSRLVDGGADLVGANCSIASKDMLELASLLRESTSLPVLCQPNAGNPVVVDGVPSYAQRPEEFASDVAAMYDLGINAVGGCCGTTPEFINHASKSINRVN